MIPRLFTAAFGAIFGLGLLSVSLHASDWPQWRGPERSGQSRETGLQQAWSKEGPKLIWQSKELGGGYSSPVVVGDRVYLVSHDASLRESVVAISAKDGQRIWAAELGKSGHPEQDPSYPGARSTPTVDGALLYALGSDGDLVCVETAAGKERWRKHLRTDFGGRYGEWAYSESPLIDGAAIICSPGGSNATMVALEKASGNLLWKCPLPEADDASYASAVIGEFGGVKQYVQFLSKGLAGVDPKSGRPLWRYARSAKGSPAVILTPLISDGAVYSGAFRAGGALVRPVKREDGFAVEEVYFNNKLPYNLGGVVKVGDYFYGCNSQSLVCVDYLTGAIQWEERSPGVALLVADGRIYAHTVDGAVVLIEPSPKGYSEKGRFTPPGRPESSGQPSAWAYPALSDGRLYIREAGSLWCYDVRQGEGL